MSHLHSSAVRGFPRLSLCGAENRPRPLEKGLNPGFLRLSLFRSQFIAEIIPDGTILGHSFKYWRWRVQIVPAIAKCLGLTSSAREWRGSGIGSRRIRRSSWEIDDTLVVWFPSPFHPRNFYCRKCLNYCWFSDLLASELLFWSSWLFYSNQSEMKWR